MNNRQVILNLSDVIKGEINRICVTDELAELSAMHSYVKNNLEKLVNIRYMELRKETNNDRNNKD